MMDRNATEHSHVETLGDKVLAGIQSTDQGAGGVMPARHAPESMFGMDDQGNPRGGSCHGEGFWINWQNGINEPNGATLEDVLEGAAQRLRFFQSSKFACVENGHALADIESAIFCLGMRTKNRQARGVEGTYQE